MSFELVEASGFEEVTTAADGSSEVALAAVMCSDVVLSNLSDAHIRVRKGSRTSPGGLEWLVPPHLMMRFRGLTNSKELWVRRDDLSTEQVTLQFMWEGAASEVIDETALVPDVRTVPFQDILYFVATKRGLDPVKIAPNQAEALARYINFHVRRAVEREPWPEWTEIEERFYRDVYDDDIKYSIGAEVRYGDPVGYWRKLDGAGAGTIPVEGSSWTELTAGTDFDRYIQLDQDGETPIGTVFEITSDDPRLNAYAESLGYWFSRNGIQVSPKAGDSVWVRFRKRPPIFSATVLENDEGYAAGTIRYWPTTGECYKALVVTSAGELPTDATKWEFVPFLYVLAPYVKFAVEAETLEEEGQDAKALRRRADAEDLLGDEWEKSEGQQQQERRFTVNVRRRF